MTTANEQAAATPEPDRRTRPPHPWSRKARIARALWMLVGRPLFRITFHNWYGIRVAILRLFGADIGSRTQLRPTARIEIPWLLTIDGDSCIGDHAIIYNLGRIRIGRRTLVSQYAHLCAGTHDYTTRDFPLIRNPITLGDDVWIGADAFIGPGVTVGDRTVVGARSSLYKDAAPGKVYVGNPARPIKDRELK